MHTRIARATKANQQRLSPGPRKVEESILAVRTTYSTIREDLK